MVLGYKFFTPHNTKNKKNETKKYQKWLSQEERE